MLRDPKPLVVGIAWVVECVEQRKKVDETKFLVDVEDMQYSTGTSKVYFPHTHPLRCVLTYLTLKRRRSMLPRPLHSEMPSEMPLSSDTEREDGDADQSIDGSSSCKYFHPLLRLWDAESIYSAMIIEVLPPLELARRRKSMLVGPRP